jgi:hypothetical protein
MPAQDSTELAMKYELKQYINDVKRYKSNGADTQLSRDNGLRRKCMCASVLKTYYGLAS